MIEYLDKQGLAHLWEKIKQQNNIFSDTTAGWASKPRTIGKQGAIYIYTDYKTDEQGQPLAGFKVGDGNAYLIDLPFQDELLYGHINDLEIHVTAAEKEFWNNKDRCYVDPDNEHRIIFTKF